MPEPDYAPVAVGKMNVPKVAGGVAVGLGGGALLDVHVKQVSWQFHGPGAQRIQKRGGVAQRVEEVGLVAVEGFVEPGRTGTLCSPAEILQGFPEPFNGLGARQAGIHPALHRSYDGLCPEFSGEFDDLPNEFPRRFADGRVSVQEMPWVDYPAASGSNRCHLQRVSGKNPVKSGAVDGVSRRWKDFNRIKAQSRC